MKRLALAAILSQAILWIRQIRYEKKLARIERELLEGLQQGIDLIEDARFQQAVRSVRSPGGARR